MRYSIKPKSLKRALVVSAAAGLAASSFAVPEAAADHPPGKGGKFTVHINRGISGFDHIKVPQGGMGRYQVLFAVHERLFEMGKDGKLIPRLGVKATPNGDFTKWKVELRKGVRFSNGEELTAEAYTHHFKRLLSSGIAGQFRALIGSDLRQVVEVDKHTIEFQFGRPNLAFEAVMASGGVWVWYLNAPGFAKANEKKPDYNRMSAGAGPYMIKEWIPGKGITVVRNPNYWNPEEQHADEIFYRITTGPETAGNWNAVRAGDLDASWSLNGSILPRAMKASNLTVLNGGRGQLHWSLNFNQTYKPLDDVRVRRAFAHAINREAIRKIVTRGMAKAADQSFPPESPWHCKGVGYPEYNPEKAKALLKEYGKPLPPLDIWALNIPSFKKVVVMIQDMMKKVGVTVNVKTGGRGPTGVIGKIIKGETPMWMNPMGSRIHPTVYRMDMHSQHKGNNWRVKNANLDAAIEKVRAARSRDEVMAAHCNFQKVQTEEIPFLPFNHAIAAIIHQKDIGGLSLPNDPVLGYHKIFRK